MLADILIPIQWSTDGNPLEKIFAGIFNTLIMLVVVFLIAWAVHSGWNAAS